MLCDTRTEYDWKELKIDNLPPDIFKDNVYEFQYIYLSDPPTYHSCIDTEGIKKIFNFFILGRVEISYRKPQLKQPTHKERIVGCINGINSAVKTFGYKEEAIEELQDAVLYLLMKSADIPPEK